jgi:hypothetical protein
LHWHRNEHHTSACSQPLDGAETLLNADPETAERPVVLLLLAGQFAPFFL